MNHATLYIWKLMASVLVFGMTFLLTPQWEQMAALESVPGQIPIEALDPSNECYDCELPPNPSDCDTSPRSLYDSQADDAQTPPSAAPSNAPSRRLWLNPDAPLPASQPCPVKPSSGERPNV